MATIESIVQGLVTYGVKHRSLQALDEAVRILVQNPDPHLQHLLETLIEGYIRVGCTRIVDCHSSVIPGSFEGILEPFETALTLLKTGAPPSEIQIRITDCIDIMLKQMQDSRDTVLVIPMALFSLEIENEHERTAMIQRILTPFTEQTQEFDSADPYEATAYLLEGIDGATASPPVLDLMHRLFKHTADLYSRYSGIYRVASAYLVLGEAERAESIIRRLHETIDEIPDPAVRLIMLSGLAGLMAALDHRAARDHLAEAERMLGSAGEEREDLVRKHLVYAFREICAATDGKKDLDWAIEQARRIEDPIDRVDALSAVYDMADEPAVRKEVVSMICQAVAGIPSVYARLPMLFYAARFVGRSGDEDAIELILESMERTAGSIRIPFITAMTQLRMAGMLYYLYRTTGSISAMERATAIASAIEDERVRYILMVQNDNLAPRSWEAAGYGRILDFRERLRRGDCTRKDMGALDRAIGAAPDRMKRAIYYTEAYVFARDAGQHEIAERMLRCALDEAGKIRPLSRRAIALGDMACRLHAARYEDRVGNLLDLAVNEVLNIRDRATRESIYDELDMSIGIIQEYWL
jgi:tetratricopeptide (TPR) repeat protein